MLRSEYSKSLATTQATPRTDADWLAANTATLDGHYCYTACPVCGSADIRYRWVERNPTYEYRGRCNDCGWAAWLPAISSEIEDALYAVVETQAVA